MVEPLDFYKMTGAGNDFLVGDNRTGSWSVLNLPALARGLCRRGLSVGGDGLVLVESSKRARFRVRVFNSDGSEAGLCGNGTRCAVRFALLKVISGRQTTVETASGVAEAEICPDDEVCLKMTLRSGAPRPLTLVAAGKSVEGYLVTVGVPHFIVFVKEADTVPVATLGPLLRHHADLGPGGANVDFLELRGEGSPHMIRTFERGVEGETLACGTGVSAAGWLLHHTFAKPALQRFQVRSRKILEVQCGESVFPGELSVRLKGEARIVFRGQLTAEAIEEALTC